ncbi:hypothetical protein Pres01_07320 [Metapseudomonas resinovorans]|nr:hypothetical protein Pres01_07320 [Pseudomonas resinovorans]
MWGNGVALGKGIRPPTGLGRNPGSLGFASLYPTYGSRWRSRRGQRRDAAALSYPEPYRQGG